MTLDPRRLPRRLVPIGGVALGLGVGAACQPSPPLPATSPAPVEAVAKPVAPGTGPAALPLTPPELPPAAPPGPLTGRVVVLSAGHGRLIHMSKDGRQALGWAWQRDIQNGIREDAYTQAFITDLLAPRLEALGATVLSLRERDRHDQAVRVDDGGEGFRCSAPGQPAPSELLDGGGALTLPADAWAEWALTAPADGDWYVYARWAAASAHDPAARYVVRGGGGAVRTDVDQRRHEGIWWPIGGVSLRAGEQVSVSLQGSGGGALSADSIRLGGGSYHLDDPRMAPADPVPWFEVSTSQHLPQLGGPQSLLWLDDGARISDMRLRARWTSWATDEADRPVFLSVHTNAGAGRGTIVFYGVDPDAVPPVPSRPRSKALAATLVTELRQELRRLDPRWGFDGPNPGNYSEISPFWNDVDGAMVELGFHDSASDARRMRDPQFQAAAAVAITRAIERWAATP
jgi:N-acetylmuramoyl-L-alanine amidase